MNTLPPAALSIQGVAKAYGAVKALNGLSFDIQQGEFFGLLGPNGAGKSTLISIISGLIRADAGTVAVLGHDTVSDWRAARRKLGVVPQELVFDPFFKVVDLLRIQAGYYGCGREVWPWIDEMLERLELANKRSSMMRTLSGGMKRRRVDRPGAGSQAAGGDPRRADRRCRCRIAPHPVALHARSAFERHDRGADHTLP